VDCGLDITAWC